MDGNAQVRLVFAGELLNGFSLDDVKRAFGRAFQLEGDRLDNVFAGGRTVLKRSLGQDDATRYVERLRKLGMQVLVEPMDGTSKPAPAAPPKPVAAPTPVAAAVSAAVPARPIPDLVPMEEMVTCPNCGERQTKRVLCSHCATDIPRALANKQEELDRARAERLAARNGGRGATSAGGNSRFAPPRSEVGSLYEASDELPPLVSLSFEGRMGRVAYLNTGLAAWGGIALAGVVAAILVPMMGGVVLVPAVIAFAVFAVWSLRVAALRLHDMNRSGWWTLAQFVPLLGLGLALAMLFWPGTEGDNDYGPQPRQGNALAAIIIGVLLVVMMLFGMGSYRSYVKKARAAEAAQGIEQFDPAAEQAADVIAGPQALKAFTEEYLPAPNRHKAFAASDSGAFGWRAGQPSPREAATQALAACEAARQAYTQPCKLMNINGQWLKQR